MPVVRHTSPIRNLAIIGRLDWLRQQFGEFLPILLADSHDLSWWPYLKRMRPVFQHLNQQDIWGALIARIREKNRALHALKEDLDRAGL
jgi:predicted nucleic acid-binding protein